MKRIRMLKKKTMIEKLRGKYHFGRTKKKQQIKTETVTLKYLLGKTAAEIVG